MMSRSAAVIVSLMLPLALALAAGCGGGGLPAPAEPLRVAAASDLQPALADLEAGFRKATGRAVQLVAGSSGTFAQQIRQGAPFDVFLSADREYARALEKEGVIVAGSVKAYALGTLVLALRAEADGGVATLEDLARPEVKRIAIANPEHAPYGRAARQALEEAGLWEGLQPKVVLADSVRQATQFVETGNADAGLVGKAVADAAGLATRPVPPRLYDPIVQGLGIVAASKQREHAQAFVDFLLAPDGQDILRAHGFAAPRPGGAAPTGPPPAPTAEPSLL
jgi:molybdate transport system substrate-binding protein